MKREVTTLKIVLEQTDGERAFSRLLREAISDITADRVNEAGTHVAGIGYYRVIESQWEED